MLLEEITRLLQARMFTPFRIHTSNNEHFDVHHPWQVWPTARTIFVGVPGDNLPPHVSADYSIIALIHIVRIEPLAVETEGNGQLAN